ncbi:endoplasmic reticulum metallopeptidase 1-like isoform X1 [Cucurbita moschata]|uniref:Endoplasmic reticulum metallopeptidase 1-like isoform X1 n=1 Tax=Cucurbita moschata TaxID=3662 RepID=A0A6J1HG47_CUCMO|nr:endoplasmic reticulum metallopeptidase 1-like isoform X1 [Cucurbita moschata]
MAFGLNSDDVTAFKLLLCLAVMYGLMSMLAHSIVHMKFVKPLAIDAPLDRFSEARAVEHVRFLSQEIDGRQEGRPGLREAARYINGQLEMMKERASDDFRIEIEETVVDGSFSMMFLGHSISLGYRNHTNILMRISSVDSRDTDPSVLINGHFDSPLGSPGAGDCGTCVASMLEVARLIVDSGWVPPRPVIFLFNGAEELFLLGSHGFMEKHRWHDTIGAFVNVEASGTGGLDLVCQSGPGSWPSRVYAQSAVYPMAHSAAQDVFPVIPGDTDYRIFSQDNGNIPGLDIIFLFGGYFYHTSYDTVERLLPGSIQARGENLFSIIKGFTNSSMLQNFYKQASPEIIIHQDKDDGAIFFDYLSWFMVFYSSGLALVLHKIPIAVFLILPFLLNLRNFSITSCLATFSDLTKGFLSHALGVFLAIVSPVMFSILRLLFTNYSMNWFSHPYLAYLMFVPCSLVGLLIPRTFWSCFPLSQDISVFQASRKVLSDEARFWGAFGFFSSLTMAYLLAGLSGGFLTFFACISMLAAWLSFSLAAKHYGRRSLRSILFFVLPMVPYLAYSVYFGGFLAQFLIEKTGMMGSIPPPYGYFIPDIVVAVTIGVVTSVCIGPLIPVCGHWLAMSSILQFLLQIIVIGLAVSSQFFPYSMAAPKRVVLQQTYRTSGPNHLENSSYELSVVDSNSLIFLLKHAPDVANELQTDLDLSFETANLSRQENWLALFPVSFMFSRSLKFPAKESTSKKNIHFPYLISSKPQTISDHGSRRVYLELSLGSLEEVWVTVLNVTGPLSNWSFADNKLPAPEILAGGPPSYICRLSGASHENWRFWLEAESEENLRIDVAVLDQQLTNEVKRLKSLFPDWVDVTAYSSFMSTYTF